MGETIHSGRRAQDSRQHLRGPFVVLLFPVPLGGGDFPDVVVKERAEGQGFGGGLVGFLRATAKASALDLANSRSR